MALKTPKMTHRALKLIKTNARWRNCAQQLGLLNDITAAFVSADWNSLEAADASIARDGHAKHERQRFRFAAGMFGNLGVGLIVGALLGDARTAKVFVRDIYAVFEAVQNRYEAFGPSSATWRQLRLRHDDDGIALDFAFRSYVEEAIRKFLTAGGATSSEFARWPKACDLLLRAELRRHGHALKPTKIVSLSVFAWDRRARQASRSS